MTVGTEHPLEVQVVAAHGHRQRVVTLHLTPGATVSDALRAAGVVPATWTDAPVNDVVARFGRPVALDARLEDGDRLELCGPLQVDPKEARRARARRRGR